MAEGAIEPKNEKFRTLIRRVSSEMTRSDYDFVAVEEPVEIRLGYIEDGKRSEKAISITMRTPGDDFELAAGFLFTEGVLHSRDQVESIKHCGIFPNNRNTVRIDLRAGTQIDFKKLERNFYTSSSCGVCGKSSIEAVATGAKRVDKLGVPRISGEILHDLPKKLITNQRVFDETGGLHAAGLFDVEGNLLDLREDVGRHNAVDKLIGKYFLEESLPLDDKILFLSGRASFELVQKAVMAQIPIIAAVGAPSSLAVQAANEFNVTLVGFVREERFNIYTGSERVK
jgi:FdhD protein